MGLCGSCSTGRVPSETTRVCHTRQGGGTACAHLGERALRGNGACANRHEAHAKPGPLGGGGVRPMHAHRACRPTHPLLGRSMPHTSHLQSSAGRPVPHVPTSLPTTPSSSTNVHRHCASTTRTSRSTAWHSPLPILTPSSSCLARPPAKRGTITMCFALAWGHSLRAPLPLSHRLLPPRRPTLLVPSPLIPATARLTMTRPQPSSRSCQQ